jgi:hypothetical protein
MNTARSDFPHSDDSRVVEIRPNRVWLLPAFLIPIFGLGGAAFLFTIVWLNEVGPHTWFLLILATFATGIGCFTGWTLIRKFFHRGPTLVLSPQGLTNRLIPGTVTVPWSDIEQVGTVQHGKWKVPGIKLRSYDNYLSSLTPAGQSFLTRHLWFQRVGVWFFRIFVPTFSVAKVSTTNPVVRLLEQDRRFCGYDITFAILDIDRSGEAFAELLRSFTQRHGNPAPR